jgi:hypothetical protein
VDRAHTAGGFVPRLLISPNGRVYVLVWNSGAPNGSFPRLLDYGVDGSLGSKPASLSIPPIGSRGCPHHCWSNGTPGGDEKPYVGAGIDARGNVYVLEDYSSKSGNRADSGYLGNLAWSKGNPMAARSWHFTQLPTVAAARGGPDDFRYAYSFVLPGAHGALDIVSTDDVSCRNTSFTANRAISNPPYTTSDGYMQDRVYDWHTADVNARGGPRWRVNRVSKWTRADPHSYNCGSGIYKNAFASDAFRDRHGRVHVIYALGTQRAGHHAILNRNGSVRTDVSGKGRFPAGYCDNTARISQDYSGRFYLFMNCGRSLYVWPAKLHPADGVRLLRQRPVTLTNAFRGPPYFYYYFAEPSAGTPTDRSYLDMLYPTDSGASIVYSRVSLTR